MIVPANVLGPSISLNSVSLTINEQVLLDDITCHFSAGGWHAVLGPNGGGKSTLLKTLLGLNPHQGELVIDWPVEPTSLDKRSAQHARLGYIPQLVAFDASLPISVRDYLLMTLSIRPVWFHRALPPEVENALQQIGLETKLDRKVGDLSGGERQRLMLATALLKQPKLLILDEPMTGLDKSGKAQVVALLEAFHQAGGTIIMVEHDWELVKRSADTLSWIDKTYLSLEKDNDMLAAQAKAMSLVESMAGQQAEVRI